MNLMQEAAGKPTCELPPGAMLIVNEYNGAIGLTMPDGETYVLGTYGPYMDIPHFVQRAIEAWIG